MNEISISRKSSIAVSSAKVIGAIVDVAYKNKKDLKIAVEVLIVQVIVETDCKLNKVFKMLFIE